LNGSNNSKNLIKDVKLVSKSEALNLIHANYRIILSQAW